MSHKTVEEVRAGQQDLLDAVKDRWPGPPVSEVDRVARLMIATWEKAERTTVGPCEVASFVDMARVVVEDTEAQVFSARNQGGLTLCIHGDTLSS